MFMYAKLKVKVNHEYIILISAIVFNCMAPMFMGCLLCAFVFIYIHCNLMAITWIFTYSLDENESDSHHEGSHLQEKQNIL